MNTLKDKEFKTIQQQIDVLTGRNLKIHDKVHAKSFLRKYNYFDVINGYESCLLYHKDPPKLYKRTYFKDFSRTFLFDKKLKSRLLYEILDIESRLRSSISHNFAKIYCSTLPETLRYTESSLYINPNPMSHHICNVFNKFSLFRQTTYNTDGSVKKRSYIDEMKDKKDYMSSYNNPPFWITIKTLDFGNLLYLFMFLPHNVKELVLKDFGFSPSDADAFTQALFILKEARNQSAHLELITRFKIKADPNLNYYNDAKTKFGLSRREIYFIDIVRIIKKVGKTFFIKREIFMYYIKMSVLFRKKIANKILSKMGRKSIFVWIKL